MDFAQHVDPQAARLRERLELIHEYPLSPQVLAMTHCWEGNGERVVAVKGSPEAIAQLCRLHPLERDRLLTQTAALAERGQRVLGVARARWSEAEWPAAQTDFQFELLGLIALSDPVRHGVREAVKQCSDAGIRVADDHR